MKRFALFFVTLIVLGSQANADDSYQKSVPPQPAFAPVVLQQADIAQLTNYLNGVRYDVAAPIFDWLRQKEAVAQAEKLHESAENKLHGDKK